MKPVPFLAAVVPALATLALISALRHGLVWYHAAALFYGALAVVELAYLAAVFASGGQESRALQERRAK